jgi:deoxycytidine triphosphate deaminase/cell division protein FtsL
MFAENEDQAKQLFEGTRHTDPLPKVASSLLNTADLLDYIAATGMIFPFDVPKDRDKWLKPASCAISFAGKVIHWNPDPVRPDKPQHFNEDIKRGQKLKLPPNSIVFITLEPCFRLPDYIAGRFNLTIRHVHRGLLVGTGPLVDPGFTGHLYVPVHNLTGDDYEITAGEPLVWMEFTKLSPNQMWTPNARESPNDYVRFPDSKSGRTLEDSLKAASPNPIVSSIPQEVGIARHAAQQAQGAAEQAKSTLQRLGSLGLVSGVILLVTIAAFVLDVAVDVWQERKDRSALRRQVTDLDRSLVVQRRELQAVNQRLRRLTTARQP